MANAKIITFIHLSFSYLEPVHTVTFVGGVWVHGQVVRVINFKHLPGILSNIPREFHFLISLWNVLLRYLFVPEIMPGRAKGTSHEVFLQQ
jgi:hypothetical protein